LITPLCPKETKKNAALAVLTHNRAAELLHNLSEAKSYVITRVKGEALIFFVSF
jgi:hypothetical protein